MSSNVAALSKLIGSYADKRDLAKDLSKEDVNSLVVEFLKLNPTDRDYSEVLVLEVLVSTLKNSELELGHLETINNLAKEIGGVPCQENVKTGLWSCYIKSILNTLYNPKIDAGLFFKNFKNFLKFELFLKMKFLKPFPIPYELKARINKMFNSHLAFSFSRKVSHPLHHRVQIPIADFFILSLRFTEINNLDLDKVEETLLGLLDMVPSKRLLENHQLPTKATNELSGAHLASYELLMKQFNEKVKRFKNIKNLD